MKRKLHTRVASFHRGYPIYVRQVDLDERTGRLLIEAGYLRNLEETQPFVSRVYLADFPKFFVILGSTESRPISPRWAGARRGWGQSAR